MQAIVTVVGKDQVGIIAEVSALLAENNVNIVDISQSLVQDYFNMFMVVDLKQTKESFKSMKEKFQVLSEKLGIEINFQRTEVFETMHRIAGAQND